MVGQDVHTTLKVAIREDVYSGCAEYPASNDLVTAGRRLAQVHVNSNQRPKL